MLKLLPAKPFLFAAVACILAPAPSAGGQTYTWSGDVFGRWSDSANWLGGFVPTSGADVQIIVNGGLNDLPGLRVGTLEIAGHWAIGEAIGVVGGVVIRESAIDDAWTGTPLVLEGDVSVKTGRFPYWLPDGPNDAWDLPRITGFGRLTVDGAVRVLDSTFAGEVNVLETSLFAIADFDGTVRNRGVLDFAGATTGSYDGRGGVMSNQGNTNAFAPPLVTSAEVQGDARLGRWYLGGIGSFPEGPIHDTLHVGGTLDLTEASLEGAIVFVADLAQPLPLSLVLATYAERTGEFPQSAVGVAIYSPDFSHSVQLDGRLAYEGGDGHGPGRVLVILPEPGVSALAACIAASALVRRHRRGW